MTSSTLAAWLTVSSYWSIRPVAYGAGARNRTPARAVTFLGTDRRIEEAVLRFTVGDIVRV
ncbi:hypothetical protein GCM10023238_38360 [Streptomyces heliomycini]